MPLLLLVLGAAGLIIGCSVAYFRDQQNERRAEMGSDLDSAPQALVSVYGAEGGALSYDLFTSRPDLMSEAEPLMGRTGKVTISPMGMDSYTTFFPDKASFDRAAGGSGQTIIEVVPLDIGGGKVIPARMEVVLVG